MYSPRENRGFTLVEILVALAVVGLLALIVAGSLSGAREKSRDAKRLSDLQNMEVAIRLYAEANGEYPPECQPDTTIWAGPGPHPSSWGRSCDEYIEGLAPNYIRELPTDPNQENDNDRGYIYRSDGTDYKLIVHGTVESGSLNAGEPYARCPSTCSQAYCSQASYAVYSPGAACW